MTCSEEIGTGGVQQVFRDLMRALENAHRRVDVIEQAPLPSVRLTRTVNSFGRETFSSPMPTIVKNSVLLSVFVSLAWLPVSLCNLIRLLAARRIHAINCHYLTEYFLHLVLAGRLMRIPVIVSVHGADVDRYASAGAAQRLILRLIMRGAHVIVACSAAMARQTADVFPFARQKITHIHNALHLDDLELGVGVLPKK